MLPEAKRYAFIVLKANPCVLRQIVEDKIDNDLFWDFKPYPDRFTMRSVLAHVADWDIIFAGRIEKILSIDTPELPAFDEVQMAIDNDYAHQSPRENFDRWKTNRASLLSKLIQISDESVNRQGIRPGEGLISIADYMALIALHDGYHIGQALDYVQKWRDKTRK